MPEQPIVPDTPPETPPPETPPPETPPPETPPPETLPESTVLEFLEADGTFKEGWVEALTPEDFRTAADKVAYGSVNSLKAVLKQLAHQNRTLQAHRKEGKGIIPLGKEPTATELELYRAAMGVPQTPDGYKVKVPEGLGEYYDEQGMKDALKALHALHLSPAQVAGVMGLDEKRLRDGIEENEQTAANARAECETALREEWGENYDAKVRLANRVIAENVPQEDEVAVLAVIGNDVKVARLFAKLGEAYLEDKVISTDEEPPSSVTSEIDRLQATPGFANGELKRTNRKEHDRIVARLDVLYGRKFPEAAATTRP